MARSRSPTCRPVMAAEEPLAGGPDQQRAAERAEGPQLVGEQDILLGGLREAESGVEDDAIARRCPADSARSTASRSSAITVADQVAAIVHLVVRSRGPADRRASASGSLPPPPRPPRPAMAGSRRSPETSLIDGRPRIERGTRRLGLERVDRHDRRRPPADDRPRRRATTRAISSATLTASGRPGRVDSPPTSSTAAPSASSDSARASAASTVMSGRRR